MKPLKPSMREKKRYLLVRGKTVQEDIEQAIVDFMGTLGVSIAGLSWIEKGKDYAIIAVNRETVNQVRAALTVWPEKMTVERVSGSVKNMWKKQPKAL
ncbi:MAG TPA: hypothetical protein ENG87_04835 [Candidatus Pacearchaeota archaeon]|nr:hypothetical protein BMS3Abin17_00868 [archaeon BMS3Abin17]HDK42683.1 hypothetical protein [Candidatus Pacearchaeota archaeon]HDZ61351.1 hypothetical protein [Candidatus Pacearchaeota archaeon]